MIPNRRYRFFIVNPCDVIATFAATYVSSSTTVARIIVNTTGITVGSYVLLEGFSRKINGVQKVITVTSTYIEVVTYGFIDSLEYGTVKLLTKRAVDPLNFYNTKFIWENENDQIFFRKKLSGKLKFNNHADGHDDYSYFLNHILTNPCCRVKFVIERRCSNMDFGSQGGDPLRTEQSWNTEWEGYLTHNMGKWNLSHCEVEMEPEPDDPYTCLLESGNDEINILAGVDVSSVAIEQQTFIEEIECCETKTINFLTLNNGAICQFQVDSVNHGNFINEISVVCDERITDHPETWTICRSTISGIPPVPDVYDNGDPFFLDSVEVCTVYQREVAYTIDVAGVPQPPDVGTGNAWVNIGSLIINGNPSTKWVRLREGCYGFQTPDFVENNFTSASYSDDCSTFYFNGCCQPAASSTTYTRGRNFSEVCKHIVTTICSRIAGIRSDFFEINPPGDTPGYVAGVNYVTGDPNVPAHMLLIQNTDFTNPTATEPASIGNMTFNELERLWMVGFNCFWFIDDDGFVRVEHISWFRRSVNADTTTTNGDNKHRNKGLKQFAFDKVDIPKQENFSFATQLSFDFVGAPIKYNSACVNPRKILEQAIDNITTDVNYVTSFPDQLGEQGFVLVALNPNDLTQIDIENGKMTGIPLNNGHLAWANLHYNYHRHNRWLIDGNMNGIDETFLSARKTKRQVPVRYAGNCCITIDPMTDLVKSELGNGEIDKMERSNRDELYSFELLF